MLKTEELSASLCRCKAPQGAFLLWTIGRDCNLSHLQSLFVTWALTLAGRLEWQRDPSHVETSTPRRVGA